MNEKKVIKMSYIMKTNLANSANYGGKRSANQIKFIVIHFTSNDGDSDENNGKYFHNNVVKASAHYFVDSDSVTQSVPDLNVAYAVGGGRHTSGGGTYFGVCTNTNSLSIELCDDNRNGVIYPSQDTIKNAIKLTKTLMEKYNIDQKHVIRHYDVNGKLCPEYWVSDSKWKKEFWNQLSPSVSNYKSKTAPKYKIGEVYTLRTDLKLRKTPKKNSEIVPKKTLSVYGQSCCTNDKPDAVLKKGTEVTCRDYKTDKDGNLFIKTYSGWLLAWNSSTMYINIVE